MLERVTRVMTSHVDSQLNTQSLCIVLKHRRVFKQESLTVWSELARSFKNRELESAPQMNRRYDAVFVPGLHCHP